MMADTFGDGSYDDYESEVMVLHIGIENREYTGRILNALLDVDMRKLAACNTPGDLGRLCLNQTVSELGQRFVAGEDLVNVPPDTPFGVEDAIIASVQALVWYDKLSRHDKPESMREVEERLLDTFDCLEELGEDSTLWLEALRQLMPHAKILGDESIPAHAVLLDISKQTVNLRNEKALHVIQREYAKEALTRALALIQPDADQIACFELQRMSGFFHLFATQCDGEDSIDMQKLGPSPTGFTREMYEELVLKALDIYRQLSIEEF